MGCVPIIFNESNLVLHSDFLCYDLFIGCKTYEADKDGRITVYPSLNGSSRKIHGILKATIKKLIEVVRGIGKSSRRV